MIKKLLGLAAMAAVVATVAPAQAAKMGGGCTGANLTKTGSSVEAMADGPTKTAAQKEVAMAQEAMLAGKMGACGAHLGNAMHAGMSK